MAGDSPGGNAFQQALKSLNSYGTPEVVAAFQVGWGMQHLRCWKPSQRDDRDWAARKVLRLEAALDDLKARDPARNGAGLASTTSAVATQGGDDPFAAAEYPSTMPLREAVRQFPEINEDDAVTDLEAELKGFHSALDEFDARFWRAVLVARECAAFPKDAAGSQQPPAAIAAAVADAYQLGLRLSSVCSAGAAAASEHDLKAAISRPDSKDATEAYALASRLRGSFPAGAAFAVARHIEDWSDWVNDAEPPIAMQDCQKAMFLQGKVWESLLTGQSLGKDYLVSSSYVDAADHILVKWGLSTASLARTMRRTAMGKLVLVVLGLALIVSLGTLVYQFGLTSSVRSDGTTGPSAATIVTVLVGILGSAAGLVHYARAHIMAATARIWELTEPALVASEVLEAIAIATRRLPTEGMSGGAGERQRPRHRS
jgi:hypothetical protein